jgi:hypothetical protein
MTARRHHYVSQCYLKGFVHDRDDPKLFVVDAKERKSFVTAPDNVAAQRDFHTIDIEGHAPDALENALSGFETELDWALRRIAAAKSIQNENDRAYLFNLIGTQATKHPQLRKIFEDFKAEGIRQIMRAATATPERWEALMRRARAAGEVPPESEDRVSYDDMKKFVDDDGYRINFAQGHNLGLELQTFDKILPCIFNRKWMTLRAPPGSTGFITSDHPMCLMWSNPAERGGFFPPGLGVGGTQLLFPVTTELVVIGAYELSEEEREATDLMVAQINGAIILHSLRQIYARDDQFTYRMTHNDRIMRGGELLEDQNQRDPLTPPD